MYNPRKPDAVIVAAPGRTLVRPRDLIGKTLSVGSANSPVHMGAREWLEKNGVDEDDVDIVYIPFPQVVGALAGARLDAAVVAEPFLTQALEQGAKQFATHLDAVCSKTCQLGLWLARANVNPNLAARFRNAVQNAAVWANQDRNDRISGRILAKYAPIDAKDIAGDYETVWARLREKRGLIPPSSKPGDLLK